MRDIGLDLRDGNGDGTTPQVADGVIISVVEMVLVGRGINSHRLPPHPAVPADGPPRRRSDVSPQQEASPMGLYQRYVVPRLVALAMTNREFVPYRRRIASRARGRVLEIGIGSALNLPFYGTAVSEVIGVDPSTALTRMARTRRAEVPFKFDVIECSGEDIPLESRSVDTVLTTWSLCSVADPHRVLGEARRLLRPGGQLLFVEHGRSPDSNVRAWQDRIDPVWTRIAGGCHLNRKMDELVSGAGFLIDDIRTGYAPGPRLVTFLYEGRAQAN
jgi:SAM-dependent methyltransferase